MNRIDIERIKKKDTLDQYYVMGKEDKKEKEREEER